MFEKLILCSASPRRRELLLQIGVASVVFPADIDETPAQGEAAPAYVERMAREKVLSAANKLTRTAQGQAFASMHRLHSPCCLLASDTCGVVGADGDAGEILGKPENFEHFSRMMKQMSGRIHRVLTSVSVLRIDDLNVASDNNDSFIPVTTTVTTRVRFRPLTDHMIECYWRSGEPQDKAGGYGIQGKGALLVESIDGSYSNVVGLPLCESHDLLVNAGFATWLQY